MAAGSPDPLSTSWADLLREKRSVAAIVRDVGRLSITDAVDVLLDVCDELANAHANGIVHGDLGLHRVRTMWPRQPGDHVDIFALDADDTGAINFRQAFQAPALSPEQRAGRIGDQRSDIWALGAILHALVGGAPPSRRPVREVLAGAPHAIISCVESCLAENPDLRPRSVDDVAGALASFSANSAERFQALARRRIASLKAKHVNEREPVRQAMPVAPVTAPIMEPVAAVPQGRNETFPPPRMPSRPSYSEVELPRLPSRPSYASQHEAMDVRMPSRPSYSGGEQAVQGRSPCAEEWPAIHGVPSQSIAIVDPEQYPPPPPVAPYPVAPSAFPAAPVYQSAPVVIAAPSTFPSDLAPAGVHIPNPRATAPLFNPALYPAAQSSIPLPHSASATPPPVSYGYGYEAYEPYVPPPPPAHRAKGSGGLTPPKSYHPPSLGPVSVDLPDLHFPPPGRAPSFSDLAEYREAKRASRKTAIFAVVAAAAVIILGLGYGSQVIAKDRAAVRAAQAAAAAPVPPPPPAVVAPAPSASTPAPHASAPASSASAKAAPSAVPSAAPAKKPAVKRKAPSSNGVPSTRDDRPDVAAADSFNDAIGKKDPAPANALSDALK